MSDENINFSMGADASKIPPVNLTFVDESKLKRQNLTSSKFKGVKGVGTAVMPTGFGKTFVGLLILEKVLTKDPNRSATILVPNPTIKKQWQEKVNKLPNSISNNTQILTKHDVLINNLEFSTTLLIVDELHEFYAEKSSIIITKKIKFTFALCLTATPEDVHGRHISILSKFPVFDTVTEKEALQKGWISKFLEYNLGVELTADRQILYDEYSDEIATLMGMFGKKGLDLASKCLGGGKNNAGVKISNLGWCEAWAKKNGWSHNLNLNNASDLSTQNLWSPNMVVGRAKRLMNAIRERSYMLYNAPEKIPYTIEIIEKFDTLKTICFSQSTDFADNLTDAINFNHGRKTKSEQAICTVYHSNISSRTLIDPETGNYYTYKSGAKKGHPKMFGKKSLKDAAVRAITKGDCRIMSTASSFDTGLDIPDLRLGITTSGTSNFNQKKQRDGRTKRVEELFPDATVLLINIYIKDTKDEVWLDLRQSKSHNTTYWVSNVDEITYNPKEYKSELSINTIM